MCVSFLERDLFIHTRMRVHRFVRNPLNLIIISWASSSTKDNKRQAVDLLCEPIKEREKERKKLGGSCSTYDHRLTSSPDQVRTESSGRFEEHYAQTQRSPFALKAKNRKFFFTFSLRSHSNELGMNFLLFAPPLDFCSLSFFIHTKIIIESTTLLVESVGW